MAHEISVTLRSDPSPYESAIRRMKNATTEWELSTASGAEDVDERFAEVIRAFVDMERQAGRTEDDVVKGLRAIGLTADDAEDALRAIDEELGNVGDNRAADDAADSIEGISSRSTEAADGLRSLGDIAKSALEGDIAGAASTASETLLGFAGSLAGGAIGGAIGSAIGGIAATWIDQWNQAAAESEKRVDEMVDSLVAAGGRFDEEQILSGVREIQGDKEKLAQVQKIVAATGLEEAEVMRALSGDLTDGASVTRELADAHQSLADKRSENLAAGKNMNDGLIEENQEILKAQDVWNKYGDEVDRARDGFNLYSEAQTIGIQRTAEAAVAAGEATKMIDEFGNTVYSLPEGKTVVIDAQTGQARTDIETVEDYELADKTVKLSLDSSEVDNYVPPTFSTTLRVQVATAVGLNAARKALLG